MIRLVTNVLGAFAVKGERVVKKVLFTGSPAERAARLSDAGTAACAEELELIESLVKTGLKEIAVNKPSRFWGKNLHVTFVEDSEKPVDVFQIAGELGIGRGEAESMLREVSIQLTRDRLKVVERDQVIIQSVAALDDIEEVYNRLVERLREWYSIHYPELNHSVESHGTYVSIVKDYGLRKNFTKEALKLEPAFRDRLSSEAADSAGSEFSDADMAAVRSIAVALDELDKAKAAIESYVGVVMLETAPNINALVGPLLGARLIKLSNGLARMATLPAGTLQILGAEDAFFRFLRTGKKPPKHGVIFQHPEIRNAKREIRGKLARTLAAKIAVASRLDAYHGEFAGERLCDGFMKRVKSLKQ
ncbi:MAG: C/D box methylation guide ribonucleoprotein complex aNOP56 subunit [Candidatus Altiarchaeota archaeon]|nr:C/D box methylation guide ribonucleoprotein complex aNOP56 subunit [Candidatus Altiarchaeota archaeon]